MNQNLGLDGEKANHVVIVIEHTIADELTCIGTPVVFRKTFGKLDKSRLIPKPPEDLNLSKI